MNGKAFHLDHAVAVFIAGAPTVRKEAPNAETTIACDQKELTYGLVDSTFRQEITLTKINNTLDPMGRRFEATQGDRGFFSKAQISATRSVETPVFIGVSASTTGS